MKILRHRVLRLPVIAIGAVAWLAISNHCALAAFERPATSAMPACHHMAPAKGPAKQDQHNDGECCKVLRATLLSASKDLPLNGTLTFAPQAYLICLVPPAVQLQLVRSLEWDTGPPYGSSFAESVLQRSLLAHAPPFALS